MVRRGWQRNPMWLAVFNALSDYASDQGEAAEATHAVFANLKAHGYKVVSKVQAKPKQRPLTVSKKDTDRG